MVGLEQQQPEQQQTPPDVGPWCQRGPDCHSAAVSAAVRQQLRSSSAAALHYLRSCSAAVLHYLRSCSSAPPQLRDTTTGRFFFLPSPVEKEKPTTARGRHGQFSASIGICGCRREARALSVVPPSRRPLRSNNRRRVRCRSSRRPAVRCVRTTADSRGGGGGGRAFCARAEEEAASFLGFRNSRERIRVII